MADDPSRAPTEEELRAAYEAEIKKIRVEQVLLEQVVTMINLGMRRTGLSPGTEDERDLGQVRLAIDSIRVLMPLIEQSAAPQAGPVREALSQLQLAFVRLGGTGAAAGAGGDAPGAGEDAPGAGEAAAGTGEAAAGTGEDAPGAGEAGAGATRTPQEPEQPPVKPGEPGPAQRSGRLWVPGQ